jgi:hypothetical protein
MEKQRGMAFGFRKRATAVKKPRWIDTNKCKRVKTYNYCKKLPGFINHLKPTGHVMYHQFNIQQLYALPTLYLCVLYLSQNKQRLVPLTA